jgi:hypothetical protein
MKPTVYLDTSIIGYLTMWPPHRADLQARHELTRRWWTDYRNGFDLFVSDVVIIEASAGDLSAATDRLKLLADMPLLPVNEATAALAKQLVTTAAIPPKALRDAAHVAISATHGMRFLLTWNCTHLANDELTHKIEVVCAAAGFTAPRILTRQQLLETTL